MKLKKRKMKKLSNPVAFDLLTNGLYRKKVQKTIEEVQAKIDKWNRKRKHKKKDHD